MLKQSQEQPRVAPQNYLQGHGYLSDAAHYHFRNFTKNA